MTFAFSASTRELSPSYSTRRTSKYTIAAAILSVLLVKTEASPPPRSSSSERTRFPAVIGWIDVRNRNALSLPNVCAILTGTVFVTTYARPHFAAARVGGHPIPSKRAVPVDVDGEAEAAGGVGIGRSGA